MTLFALAVLRRDFFASYVQSGFPARPAVRAINCGPYFKYSGALARGLADSIVSGFPNETVHCQSPPSSRTTVYSMPRYSIDGFHSPLARRHQFRGRFFQRGNAGGSGGRPERRDGVREKLALASSALLPARRKAKAITPEASAASCNRRDGVSGNRTSSPTTPASPPWRSPSSIAGSTSASFQVSQ